MDLVNSKTGVVEQVPDTHAEAAIRSGAYTFAEGQTVHLRNETGKIGALPAEQALKAMHAGGDSVSLVSPEEYHAHAIQRDYGGAAGEAAAAIESPIRGASMGLADPAAIGAARLVGGDAAAEATRKHLAGVKEANPIISTVGELGGAIAPIALSGGAAAPLEGAEVAGSLGSLAEAAGGQSALVRGIRAAGVLPRLTAGAGALAERGAAAILPEATSLAGKVATGALTRAAGGAVEGAAYGVGNEISENSLNGGNHELTAEQLLAAAGHGALFGAALGGGLGAAGTLGSEAIGGIGSAFERKTGLADAISSTSKEAAGLADSTAEKYIANRAGGDTEKADALREIWRRRETSIFDQEDKLSKNVRGFTSDLDDVLSHESRVSELAFGESKASQMAELVNKDNYQGAAKQANDVARETAERLKLLNSDPTRGGSGVAVKRVEQSLGKLQNRVAEGEVRAHLGDVDAQAKNLFMDLDQYKRELGKQSGMGLAPYQRTEAQREFYDLYHHVKSQLEDESVWGKAALAQRDINAAATELFSTRRAFAGKFTRQGFESRAGNPVDRADPAGIHSHLNDILAPGSDLNHEALTRYLKNVRGFADHVGEHYAISPADHAAIEALRGSVDKMTGTVATAGRDAHLTSQIRRLKAEEAGAGMGGLVGLLSDVASRPVTTLGRIAAVERAATKASALSAVASTAGEVDHALTTGIKSFLSRTVETLGNAGRTTTRAAVPAAMRLAGMRAHHPLLNGYEREAEQVREYAANPAKAVDRVGANMGSLAEHAPQVSAALSMKATQINSYLASKLPPAVPGPSLLQPQKAGPPPSDGQMAGFLRVASICKNPLGIIQEIKTGRVTQDQVDALKANYPEMYKQIQSKTMEAVASREAQIPYEKRKVLGILLSIPTDPTLEKDFIQTMQTSYSTHAEPTHPGPGNPREPKAKKADMHYAQRAQTDIEAALDRRGA